MSDGQLEDLIRQVTDPRTWRVAAALTGLMKKARDSDCGCDVCVELRALAGALDDINEERS